MSTPIFPSIPPSKHTAALRLLALALALLLPSPAALAQGHKSSAPVGLSDSDKAKLRDQQAFERDTDAAYKKSLERIPAKQQKADPWGNVREAPAK